MLTASAAGADPRDLLATLALLGPIATALAALVALSVGIATVRQRRDADRRDQWWKRTQWALDLCLNSEEDDAQAAIGFAVLQVLAGSPMGHLEEIRVIEAAWKVWLVPEPGEDDVDSD